ncbi:phospholipase A [Spirosoma fluviale]|uniref:Phosphatidylcholine 1-acylhydrolase n=1 Tax=Spirosoma fluviale TaxID=1597977 RepID=A0A286GB28_9BACT|nr:phospholipase A [Spirosoma fluviale]SOD92349.1 phospholipase A1 [Spirosoma fluviale]
MTHKRLLFFCFALISLCSPVSSARAQTDADPIFTKKQVFRSLSDRWELDSTTRKGTFLVTAYKPLYITAGRWSTDPNGQPVSENPAYNYPFNIPLGRYEARFQLSLKVKVLQGIFGRTGDLWVGYTQKSHWQIYNTTFSRPFRETNYEPELILNFATNFSFLGMKTRMLGIAFNHQSNGRAVPLSRSWNRIIAQAGFERGKWVVLFRPWLRLPDMEDENPAITDNIGRADATVIYRTGRHLFSAVGSHSLRGGAKNRGQVQFDWTFPVTGNLRGDLQILHGYGETLIDYNHKQTTIGLAVSLVDWL